MKKMMRKRSLRDLVLWDLDHVQEWDHDQDQEWLLDLDLQ